MDNGSFNFSGDVQLESAVLSSSNGLHQNIVRQVLSISIFEDITSPYISGNIVIAESFDLETLLPLTGQELLSLIIKTPLLGESDGKIEELFYVYKMTDKEYTKERVVQYTLHFISLDGIKNNNVKISRAFSGKISDIANDILTNYLQSPIFPLIEDVPKKHKYVSNFWSPMQNMEYLRKQAISKNNSPFLFFRNRAGYIFGSIESIYNQDTSWVFRKDNFVRENDDFMSKNIKREMGKIKDLYFPNSYDFLVNHTNGSMGSALQDVDIFNHSVERHEYNLFQDENRVTLNPYNHILNTGLVQPNSSRFTKIKASNIFDDFEDNFGDTTNHSTMPRQISISKILNYNKVNVTVMGNFRITAGMKVFLDVPSVQLLDKDGEVRDSKVTGYYLVKKIRHFIERGQPHLSFIDLVSDSMQKNVLE